MSAITSFTLVLPLAFFSAAPFSTVSPSRAIVTLVLQQSMPFAQDNAKKFPRPLRAVLHASTLILTLPQVLFKIPSIPLPFQFRHVTSKSISHLLSAVVIFSFSVGTLEFFYALSNVTLAYTLAGTYLLPGKQPFPPTRQVNQLIYFTAALHVTLHNIRKPLSIILPPQTQPAQNLAVPDSALNDPLLQRKERLLQRRRLYRRLIWDIGTWMLLVPVGGGGLVWACGRLAGKW